MANLYRLQVAWSGVNVVGLASTVLHYATTGGTAPDVAAIRTAFFNARSAFPVSTVIQVPGEGVTIDAATGDLVGTWSAGSTPAAVAGSSTDTSAAGVGACVTWSTSAIVNARRLRGRSFLVPLSTFSYDQNGTLTAAQLTALQTFATAMHAVTPALHVWHRPTTSGGTDGSSAEVNAGTVRDRVAYLSSRRS